MRNTTALGQPVVAVKTLRASDIRLTLPLALVTFYMIIMLAFWPMRHAFTSYKTLYLPIVESIPKNTSVVEIKGTRRAVVVADTSIIYGPLPAEAQRSFESYSFPKVYRSYNGKVNNHRIYEIDKGVFESLMLSQVPDRLLRGIEKFIQPGLELAEKHQIDPFWIMAIMWTESHFNPKAKSIVEAQGLMQIMPATGHFVSKLMNQKVDEKVALELTKIPLMNIEMGITYLNHLLEMFNYNYKLATVAYNMGPYWVIKRLRTNKPVGVRNNYLDKVTDAHLKLSESFRQYIRRKPLPFKRTMVYVPSKKVKKKKKKLTWFDKTFPLTAPPSIDLAKYSKKSSVLVAKL